MTNEKKHLRYCVYRWTICNALLAQKYQLSAQYYVLTNKYSVKIFGMELKLVLNKVTLIYAHRRYPMIGVRGEVAWTCDYNEITTPNFYYSLLYRMSQSTLVEILRTLLMGMTFIFMKKLEIYCYDIISSELRVILYLCRIATLLHSSWCKSWW